MKTTKIFSLLILAGVCLTSLEFKKLAFACKPAPGGLWNVSEEIGKTNEIFQGRAVSLQNGKVDFQVYTVWKGDASKTRKSVQIPSGLEVCNRTIRQFKLGEDYLIFAQKQGQNLIFNMFGNSISLNSADRETVTQIQSTLKKQLGEGKLIRQSQPRR